MAQFTLQRAATRCLSTANSSATRACRRGAEAARWRLRTTAPLCFWAVYSGTTPRKIAHTYSLMAAPFWDWATATPHSHLAFSATIERSLAAVSACTTTRSQLLPRARLQKTLRPSAARWQSSINRQPQSRCACSFGIRLRFVSTGRGIVGVRLRSGLLRRFLTATSSKILCLQVLSILVAHFASKALASSLPVAGSLEILRLRAVR